MEKPKIELVVRSKPDKIDVVPDKNLENESESGLYFMLYFYKKLGTEKRVGLGYSIEMYLWNKFFDEQNQDELLDKSFNQIFDEFINWCNSEDRGKELSDE